MRAGEQESPKVNETAQDNREEEEKQLRFSGSERIESPNSYKMPSYRGKHRH